MFSLLIHLIGLALLKADQTPLNNGADAAHLCCNTLSEKLPSKVHFPGSVEYERQQYSHFLLQQADIQPSCRVSPTSSSEVSLIMKTVTEHSCPFAVRSGGHSTWPGSNVQGGVALDLGLLNSIDVDEEKGVAQLGPGCKWKNVYAAMEQYNVTTVGGRMPDVGIGGFFLGGGISLLSFRHGFGSDNVINYEVVLADGTAVSANAASHPDLFWALKLGSTNFGIVTRFDVLTYPVKEVWGGIRTYPVTSEQTPKLIENWVSFARGAATTREELQALIIGRWRKGGVDEIATIWHASLDSVAGPPLTDTPPIDDSTRTTTFLNLIDDLQSSDFADKKRNKWDAFTIKMDAPTIWDVFNGAKRTFDKLEHVSGMQWDVAFQPITQGFLTASEKTGGNPFRKVLMESGDDLALISFLVSWKDATDDETMYKAIAELGAWSEELATQRGILNNFIYLNYASGEKPVYARSLSKEDMTRMISVKRTYDADDVLGRLWKGGFKLPKDVPETIFESSASTEL